MVVPKWIIFLEDVSKFPVIIFLGPRMLMTL